jgi:uracil phosphoribosyltransferase
LDIRIEGCFSAERSHAIQDQSGKNWTSSSFGDQQSIALENTGNTHPTWYAFISAYRKHHHDGSFEICMQYMSCPSLEDRIVIICDPMLATGASIIKTIEFIKNEGVPKAIHVVCAIACNEGIEMIQRECGDSIDIWCGDIDDELTAKGYIVPGLGDAGDLAFGTKSQQ